MPFKERGRCLLCWRQHQRACCGWLLSARKCSCLGYPSIHQIWANCQAESSCEHGHRSAGIFQSSVSTTVHLEDIPSILNNFVMCTASSYICGTRARKPQSCASLVGLQLRSVHHSYLFILRYYPCFTMHFPCRLFQEEGCW